MKSVLRSLKSLRHAAFYACLSSRNTHMRTFGNKCKWTIDPRKLSSTSVVYSAGAGDDISFEKELIEQLGCRITLLDPSPTGKTTMAAAENSVRGIDYHAVGLADRDGEFGFDAPLDAQRGSYVLSNSAEMRFPCLSLQTLMAKNGHEHIDLLKMDIEGVEYAVLDQILNLRIPIRQICTEFHHFCLPAFSNFDTIRMILRLRLAGYKLVDRTYWDHTFLRE